MLAGEFLGQENQGGPEMARILIASEDYQVFAILEALFTGHGHAVSLAMTGLDACEQAVSDPPDLVILEPKLSVHDGFATCEILRDDPDVPKALPIVFFVDERIDPRVLERCGATAQFFKHWDNARLHDHALELLGEKAMLGSQTDFPAGSEGGR